MMRVLFALTLLGVAAAKEETCPIIKWLEEHGKDAFETIMECKDVPAVLKKAAESDCRSKPTPRDRVAMVVWAAITQMQHLNGTFPDLVKHSKITEAIQHLASAQLMAFTHKHIDHFCGQPQCNDLAKSITGVVAPCYGSLTCNFLTKHVPFAACKDAFQIYLETAMSSQLDSHCNSEEVVGLKGGHKYYCSEMNADLMLKDMQCYIEYKQAGARGCTPKCLMQWKGMNFKFPKCTKAFEGQTEMIYEAARTMMQSLAKAATDPNFKKAIEHMPKTLATYDDVCNKVPPVPVINV